MKKFELKIIQSHLANIKYYQNLDKSNYDPAGISYCEKQIKENLEEIKKVINNASTR